MLALKMTITLFAQGLMPLAGETREQAEAELTDAAKAQLSKDVLDELQKSMVAAGFELKADSGVDVELVEV